MNIISNSCLGSYITRDYLKTKYNNPFCWSVIDDNSICTLINDYYNINFKNYELTKDNNWNFYLTIDNKIKVWYVHYKFSEKDNPIGSYNFDIISHNKDIANLKSYRYGGKLLVKHLKDIDAWEMTVPQMEQKIQAVMDIIEAKILDNKRLQTKYDLEKIKSDF